MARNVEITVSNFSGSSLKPFSLDYKVHKVEHKAYMLRVRYYGTLIEYIVIMKRVLSLKTKLQLGQQSRQYCVIQTVLREIKNAV